MIPQAALRYIQNKKLAKGFSYKDIWNEEHATNFTVAKAMQMDLLKDMKDAVEEAISEGQTFAQFKKNLEPTLRKKEWWGQKEMEDPLTKETHTVQLGSDRRLRTIYDTNLRSAYQEGRWERSQASTAHPYLMYRVGNSKNHRKEHLEWNGLVLPKDDPWWNSHYPPNGWGCKCWTMAVSEDRKQRLEETGITVPPSVDGEPGYTVKVKTQAPKTTYKTFVNERKGTVEKVPVGVDPAFNWNVGKGRNIDAIKEKIERTKRLLMADDSGFPLAPEPLTSKGIQEMQKQSDTVYQAFTKHEKLVLDKYTKGHLDEMNEYLAQGSQGFVKGRFTKEIKSIDMAIEKFHLDKDIVVFRGTDASFYEKGRIGDILKERVYYSTSVVETVAADKAKQNLKPLLAEIRVPKGSKGLYIGENSAYIIKDQFEFLLKRGTKYLIVGKTDTHIILEVVR